MPDFGNAFSGLAAKRKLTHSELVRALRFMVAAEYEAIQLYEQLAESTDNALACKVLHDITNEEKEHVGEFLRLLRELSPEDEPFYHEGMAETEQAIAELGDAASTCCRADAACRHQEAAEGCATACSEGQQACACEEDTKRS